ncbi:MAG: nucleotide exchange factor GrpE [Parcubacteria group bacterium]
MKEENQKQAASLPTEALAKEGAKSSGVPKEDLQKKIEELEKQKTEYLASWQRERADFLNYKREEMERIGQLINYAKEELILEILPLMDNFEIISQKLPGNLQKDESIKGLLQIKIQFQDFLKSLGIEEIKSLGEKFDPRFHENVGEIDNGDQKSGTIIEEVQKGYRINGRLMRPAKVKTIK